MKLSLSLSLSIAALVLCAGLSQAAIIQFDLVGKGGAGLLSTNQNSAIAGTPGSGGEIGPGITYDNVTKVLSVSVGWGTGNGFANLTAAAVAGHIHGTTASASPGSFTEDAGVLFPLDGAPIAWNPSATNGSAVGNVTIGAANEAALLAGRMYINVHTPANGGGEIRGNLIQTTIPEPAMGLLAALGAAMLGARRRRA